MQRIMLAYKNDKKNAMVLNHLANHFFFRKQPQSTTKLAAHAYKHCTTDEMRAESRYQLARVLHEQVGERGH